MSSQFSSSRSLYSQIHAVSNAFNQGWVRGDVVTVTRSVRDIDEDKSRLFTETFQLPSGLAEDALNLFPVKGTNFEAIRPTFQDISPSGKMTLSLRQGGKSDEIPLIHLIGPQNSHYLDVSDYHGKFVGDSWFGGVSWSHDERFVAYVAYKKENPSKKIESSKYFEYRTSEKDMNKFEYVDDWGEKYVGLVSLSLNVLDTVTGDICTVEGIDDDVSTVGQPIFLPLMSDNDNDEINSNYNNHDNDNGGRGEKNDNEHTVRPSYRLAYTSWKNGPKKLGMIYCYQRESSIYVVDLTDQLISSNTMSHMNDITGVSTFNENKTYKKNTKNDSNNSEKDIIIDQDTKDEKKKDINETNIVKYKNHILVTPGIKLARSARFSPDGKKMVFLGSKKGFLSHSGCSEILSVNVNDVIKSLDNKNNENNKNVIKNNIIVDTIVPTVYNVINNNDKNNRNNDNDNDNDENNNQNDYSINTPFPGIYSDQLPKNCFLNNDIIIMTSPWGSVESLLLVEISTKKVEKIMRPNGIKNSDLINNFNRISFVLLDVNRVKTISVMNRNDNNDADNDNCGNNNENRNELKENKSLTSNILLSISSPSATAVIGILTVTINKRKNDYNDISNNNNNNNNNSDSINDKISCTLLSYDNYSPDQMPITRRKPPVRRVITPAIDQLIDAKSEKEKIVKIEKEIINNDSKNDNSKNKKDNKYQVHNLRGKSDKISSCNNNDNNYNNNNNVFNDLLNWKITRYHDNDGIPYESILISPKPIYNYNNNDNNKNSNDNNSDGRNENTMDNNLDNNKNNIDTHRFLEKCPLIVVPHGGPHGCMTSSYVASYTFLCLQLGAAVLHVNYRGSTGFGQNSIDALLGRIGVIDVADMVHCTLDAIDKNSILDKNRVAVVGGSHGGFLAAHLIGQHPDIFKVACMRNPVTDIPGMLSITDIPDWCYVEALGKEGALKYSKQNRKKLIERMKEEEDDENRKSLINEEEIEEEKEEENCEVDDFNTMPEPEDLLKMRSCSPIIYAKNVRAPVLMLIGGKDRRVPMSQGVAYYHTLRAKGVKTKLLVFPDDVHAIDRPLSEAEQWMAVADWLETYLI